MMSKDMIMTTRYPNAMIYSHWLTVVLVLIAYLSSGHPTRDGLIGELHVFSGLLVASMLIVRLPLRCFYRRHIPQQPALADWQEKAAKSVQTALYLCMALIPLSGWLALANKTQQFSAFGVAIPLNNNGSLLHFVGELHPFLGNLFLVLAGLHAAAALLHHFYFKDEVLKSMSPHRK
ncbi:cytochrome b [Pasteurellaceae bacterium USgator11]|nr:cytochrome b [Pasteurellaceae bacterium UScroc12]TNG98223.1 cytochrome b [Pasteurellaceae bacterium USgator41]TNH00330.1 cytochrome b [Pasteurellaceae bacterium UScroc31]TNH01873.1 cytochrome b [Pasteurellaceae bacterium USgator11]